MLININDNLLLINNILNLSLLIRKQFVELDSVFLNPAIWLQRSWYFYCYLDIKTYKYKIHL